MRQKIAIVTVLGVLAAGLGCRHIGGKNDCGFNPADYPILPPTAPYHSYPAPPVEIKEMIPKAASRPSSDKPVEVPVGEATTNSGN